MFIYIYIYIYNFLYIYPSLLSAEAGLYNYIFLHSYPLMGAVMYIYLSLLSPNGVVRYLIVWEKFPDKPWAYKTEEQLREDSDSACRNHAQVHQQGRVDVYSEVSV